MAAYFRRFLAPRALATIGGAGGLAACATQVTSATSPDIDGAKRAIAEVIANDEDMGPTLVRLAWHSSGTWDAASCTGGSNGATMRFAEEAGHGANAGLDIARNALEPVKAQFPAMSYSDLWILAGYTAIEEMGGPSIEFTPGRTDAASSAACPPEGRLPNAQAGEGPADGAEVAIATAAHVRDIFYRMGFEDREIVALLGAHALGRCHTEASGYWGPWTRAPTTFSNDYFVQLLENEWSLKKWDGPEQYETVEGDIMMLPSDMVLLQDIHFVDHTIEYAYDYDTFAADFAAAFKKLTEFGLDGGSSSPSASSEPAVQTEDEDNTQNEPENDEDVMDEEDEGDEKAKTLAALLSREPATAPVDPRFPNQNQNKYCYALYTKFQRCLRANTGEEDECKTLRRWTYDMCPKEWVEQWDELMESDAFPAPKGTF